MLDNQRMQLGAEGFVMSGLSKYYDLIMNII